MSLLSTSAKGAFLATAIASMIAAGAARAAQEKVIYSFTGGVDGAVPQASLLAGPGGELYGTTTGFGPLYGAVFRLAPPTLGQTQWTETNLYSFTQPNAQSDGTPSYSALMMDKAGALYGTTAGLYDTGLGTVYRLTPPAAGQTAWTHTVLFQFNQADGFHPNGKLYLDSSGAVYGTTTRGGPFSGGVAYRLRPPSQPGGAWIYKVLAVFHQGSSPNGGLVLAQDGAFYGAANDGVNNAGLIYRLTPPSTGQSEWVKTTVHTFGASGSTSPDGAYPNGPPVADRSVHLYGTTASISHTALPNGAVYRLSPPASGQTAWSQSLLYEFTGLSGVSLINLGVIEGPGSILYGVTNNGYVGSVFKLTPRDYGGDLTPWNLVTLHVFDGNVADGVLPSNVLTAGHQSDGAFALFGTTAANGDGFNNGAVGYGTIFEIIP